MGGKDAPLLLITDKNGVRTLMFNRPAQLNGWSPAMMERIEIEMRQAGNDDNVKALIVTGKSWLISNVQCGLTAVQGMGDITRLEQTLQGVSSLQNQVA
mmetsp:Transcript_13784/g.22492  ORF Transcript_13784/g.22492 Transcript_13784/m.22492 type:complete len:99 (-) Transcript_13784:612-908(-)